MPNVSAPLDINSMSKSVGVRVPLALYATIRRNAKTDDVTVSDYIVRALSDALNVTVVRKTRATAVSGMTTEQKRARSKTRRDARKQRTETALTHVFACVDVACIKRNHAGALS